jgi:choice-of-anchor C domain-containing protein
MHVARRILVAVVALGAAASLGPTALAGTTTTNLVVNGSFERPRLRTDEAFRQMTDGDIPGWNITGCVDLVSEPAFEAARGDQSVDLNGSVGSTGCTATTAAGTITSDPFTTVAGEDYLVRFFLAGNPGCNETGAAAIKSVDVLWDGTRVATFYYDVSGQSATNIDWQLRLLELEAKDNSTTLAFRSTSSGNCGPMIDAVRVVVAPD